MGTEAFHGNELAYILAGLLSLPATGRERDEEMRQHLIDRCLVGLGGELSPEVVLHLETERYSGPSGKVARR